MWLKQIVKPLVALSGDVSRSVVVALPARNEVDTITRCLEALERAAALVAAPVHVHLLVNNSDDGTAAVARQHPPAHFTIQVEDVVLPVEQAHAGGARRRAIDAAIEHLMPGDVVMTTDADSEVDTRWIAANLAEIDAGADAVAGVVTFDAATEASLPPMPERVLEWQLANLHAKLGCLLDPLANDPWPNHIWAWGASLALTIAAYRAVGGMPAVPLAEDRALAAAIERADLKLRRSHAPVVYTSARRAGRAPGGFADLLEAYATDPDAPCDAALEPTVDLIRRLKHRARLRRQHDPLGGFGAAWCQYQQANAQLVRRRLVPAQLPGEIARAERAIRLLSTPGTDRAGIADCGTAA